MLEGLSSLFFLQLQREPHILVVALALLFGSIRVARLGTSARLGLVGLALVLAHFAANALLIQMGSTGCNGCMIWSTQTHIAIADRVLPAMLFLAWLLIANSVFGSRGLWPNNSSKPTPLRGAA